MTSPTEPVRPEPSPQVSAAVAAEFETMTRRLEIEVPPALLSGVLLGYQALRELNVLLRTAESTGFGEPADGARRRETSGA
jgi:hypothetical protein